MDVVTLVPRKLADKGEDLKRAEAVITSLSEDLKKQGAVNLSAVLVYPNGNYKVYTSGATNHLLTLGALVECLFQLQSSESGE